MKKEQGERQSQHAPKDDNFQDRVATPDPFDRDILQREDQHSQDEEADPQQIITA